MPNIPTPEDAKLFAQSVFLHDLMTVAQDPKSSQDEVEMQEHRVINLLEKLLSKDSNGIK